MRQLKLPWTEPSAKRVTLNPNCENGCVPSTVPLPPPLATAGAAPAVAGTSAQAATTAASAAKNRFMLSPFLPALRGYYPFRRHATHATSARLLPSTPEPSATRGLQRDGLSPAHPDRLGRSGCRRSVVRYRPGRRHPRRSTRRA